MHQLKMLGKKFAQPVVVVPVVVVMFMLGVAFIYTQRTTSAQHTTSAQRTTSAQHTPSAQSVSATVAVEDVPQSIKRVLGDGCHKVTILKDGKPTKVEAYMGRSGLQGASTWVRWDQFCAIYGVDGSINPVFNMTDTETKYGDYWLVPGGNYGYYFDSPTSEATVFFTKGYATNFRVFDLDSMEEFLLVQARTAGGLMVGSLNPLEEPTNPGVGPYAHYENNGVRSIDFVGIPSAKPTPTPNQPNPNPGRMV